MAKQKGLETQEHQIGQDHPRDMPASGPIGIEDALIEPVRDKNWRATAEIEAFMEEPVTVMVHESPDDNEQSIVETWCNGRSQFFIRGKQQIVKRKFVGILARAKITKYKQERYIDGNGDEAIRNVPRTTLKYPFQMVSDANPRGMQWLKEALADA